VVAQAVDSVLQKVLLDPPGHLTQQGGSFQRLVPDGGSEPVIISIIIIISVYCCAQADISP
jgi:hypothetical protein